MAIHSKHLTAICTVYPTFSCLVPAFCFEMMSDSVTLHDDAFFFETSVTEFESIHDRLKNIFSCAAC